MAEQGAQEKTEAPSQKKRDDGRKEGTVAFSKEVTSAALLGALSLFFMMGGDWILQSFQNLVTMQLTQLSGDDLGIDLLWRLFRDVLWYVTPFMVALFALVMVVGLFFSVLQVGFKLNALKFEAGRMNPLKGLGRIFSSNGLAELLKNLFKMGVIGYITYYSYIEEIHPMLNLSRLGIEGILVFNFKLVGVMFGRVALALVLLAIFDYMFQLWRTEQQLKMTKQEMKEELKQSEGDPLMKSRVRQIQREMSNARMMESVPKADVVVTNPTHFAVALMYDREFMTAPQLVAKGGDFIAQRIKSIAAENNVPVVENPLVAREIFHNVEIGEQIPDDFFRAVAEILAYVYRLKGKDAEGNAKPETGEGVL